MFSSMDWNDCTCDPAGFIPTQKVNSIGNISRGSEPLEGIPLQGVLPQGFIAWNEFKRTCDRHSRLDAVGTYAFGRKFQGYASGNRLQGYFCRRNCCIVLPCFGVPFTGEG